MGDDALLYRWLDAVKSEDGPPDPMLRFLCVIIGSWCSDPARPRANVSVGTIAEQMGLRKRNVRKRIRQLEGVWLMVQRPAGKRPVFRPRTPEAGATVPSLDELSETRTDDVENSSTPDACVRGLTVTTPDGRVRGPRMRASGDPGWARPPYTYSIPTSSLGAGAREAGDDPPAPAPGDDDGQLPITGRGFNLLEHLEEVDSEAAEEYEAHLRRSGSPPEPDGDPPDEDDPPAPPREAARA